MPPPKDPIRRVEWIEERRKQASEYRHTAERKAKIGKSKEGKPRPDVSERNRDPEFVAKQAKARVGRKCKEETRELIRLSLVGREVPSERIAKQVASMLAKNDGNHSDWRGCPSYYEWKDAVKKRDNYTCQHCGITEVEYKEIQRLQGKTKLQGLHTHHIKGGEKYPEFRYDISNGLTLCPCCHRTEETRIIQLEITEKLLEVRKVRLVPLRPLTHKVA